MTTSQQTLMAVLSFLLLITAHLLPLPLPVFQQQFVHFTFLTQIFYIPLLIFWTATLKSFNFKSPAEIHATLPMKYYMHGVEQQTLGWEGKLLAALVGVAGVI